MPPHLLCVLIERLLTDVVAPGGRLILSTYTDAGQEPRMLAADAVAFGHEPDGQIRIDRPGKAPLQTIWFDSPQSAC